MNNPLWMPSGSVQSIAFLALVGAVIALEGYNLIANGVKPDTITSLVLAAAAVYWVKRTGGE